MAPRTCEYTAEGRMSYAQCGPVDVERRWRDERVSNGAGEPQIHYRVVPSAWHVHQLASSLDALAELQPSRLCLRLEPWQVVEEPAGDAATGGRVREAERVNVRPGWHHEPPLAAAEAGVPPTRGHRVDVQAAAGTRTTTEPDNAGTLIARDQSEKVVYVEEPPAPVPVPEIEKSTAEAE